MSNYSHYTADKIFKPSESVRAYFHNETYYSTPLHTHNFFELNIVMSGNGTHYMDTSSYPIAAGDVFIMPPDIEHGYTFDSKTYSIFHLLFNDEFFKKYKTNLDNMTGYHILFNIDPHIRSQNKVTNNFLHINFRENYNLTRVFEELSFLESKDSKNIEQQKESLALYVLAKICDAIEEENSSYNKKNRYLFDLLKSVEYIHLNYGEKINLQTLCSISCLSRSSYIRQFKQTFNCPPIDYIHHYRLRRAKSLLKHTEMPLTTIATNCGFCDSAHFSRLFKRKYHSSPSEYRKMYNQKKSDADNIKRR